MGVDRQTVGRWESGQHAPTHEHLVKWAQTVRMPISVLLAYVGENEREIAALCPGGFTQPEHGVIRQLVTQARVTNAA
ncbi:helix-turn-helix transcriptional regulator [Streptomyces sp. NPDC050147]|uniref:helix-turn-helix transcriptional regulator n=1 Tax=Streptomyces sp. NPDC050147 TaxID=3155513 RepID=UPI0034399F1B